MTTEELTKVIFDNTHKLTWVECGVIAEALEKKLEEDKQKTS